MLKPDLLEVFRKWAIELVSHNKYTQNELTNYMLDNYTKHPLGKLLWDGIGFDSTVKELITNGILIKRDKILYPGGYQDLFFECHIV